MALDTYKAIVGKLQGRCPALSYLHASDIISHQFREVAERRSWSWLTKFNQIVAPALYNTGTAVLQTGSTTVTGTGTAWSTALIGQQFRLGTTAPIYTIVAVDPIGQTLTLDVAWGQANYSGTYVIYQCFFTPPADFHHFISVWDPNFNYQLRLDVHQEYLNGWDPQRTNNGQAYIVAWRDFTNLTDPIPLPRYEIWPHQLSAYVYPFLYEIRPPDLEDQAATLPRYLRGDVLLEGGLAEAARWPGPSVENPNPYFNLALADRHERRFEEMVQRLEVQDDNVFQIDASYPQLEWPFAPILGDSNWVQSHAI